MQRQDFTYTDTLNPHAQRSRAMLKKYPELRQYMKPYYFSIVHITLLTLMQFALAIHFGWNDIHWGYIILCAWVIGALANHSLFAFVHESCHDLIVKSRTGNKIWGIVSNFAQAFPSSIGFRTFHLLHHAHMSEYDYDADLAFHKEAKWVGNSWWRKILWFVGFLVIEALRPAKIKKGKVFSAWMIVNLVAVLAVDYLLFHFFGMKALGYLFLSTFFSVGLHPVGARWVQEHYIYKEGQETYSYYGNLNLISYNIGYHNEHHDLHKIPWVYLPKLTKTAPEFYDNLYSHQSWTKLLLDFIFNPKRTLFCRIVRGKSAMTNQSQTFEKSTPSINEAPSLGK